MEDAALNTELLAAAVEEEKQDSSPEEPRRNSKDDLISKILQVCEENQLELEVSNSKMKRMTKPGLCKLLAEKIEEGVKSQMAAQVGAKPGSSDGVIALGALKMMHNLLAGSAEKTANLILPRYGYEVVGFTEALRDPHVDEAVTQCLAEIAKESDVMQYIESPWVRLGLAWGGALVTSIRKAPHNVNRLQRYYASPMGPSPVAAENSFQLSARRRPTNGQINMRERPASPDEKQV